MDEEQEEESEAHVAELLVELPVLLVTQRLGADPVQTNNRN